MDTVSAVCPCVSVGGSFGAGMRFDVASNSLGHIATGRDSKSGKKSPSLRE